MTDRARNFRDRWQEGPTGPAPTTESAGDPEADEPRSGAEEGAAAGGLVGTAVAGPFGLAAGAAAGAIAGAAGEAADPETDRGYERRSEGTGPTDPLETAGRPVDRGVVRGLDRPDPGDETTPAGETSRPGPRPPGDRR